MNIFSINKRNVKKLFALVVTFAILICITQTGILGASIANAAVANHVVISEVYGGGGNSGATYKNDFIELYNPTDVAVSLSGWSVQYASSTGSFGSYITNLSGSIAPHKYYLIREAQGTGGTVSLPTPDATGSIAMSATSAKVALAKVTSTVSGSSDSNVVDFIGYGSANDSEGSPAPTLTNTTSAERKDNNGGTTEGQGNGWDTNNNASDFVATSNVSPQNSASTAEPPIGSTFTPAPTSTATATPTVGSTPTPTPVATATPTPGSTSTPAPTSTPSAYNCYFGQLHSHTSNSDGKGTYSDAYTYARDTAHLDFFAITDHSNYFDNYLDWTKSVKWADMKNTANSFNADGVFAAIAAFEMTWSNGTGHINTFNTDWFDSRLTSGMDLPTYYNKIAADTGSLSQWNHPGTTFGDFNSFGSYSAGADKVIKLIEVANGEGAPGTSNYYPSYSYYTTALDKGWHVAPSNNQDNHNTNWGTANDCRTVVLAPSLSRTNVFDAIRNLRVYASEDKNLKISYTVNGSIMGAILSNPTSLNISITATDSDTNDNISKIELVSDGGVVSASQSFSSNSVVWNPQLTSQYKYYYVRITMANGAIAVTAPVWTGK